MTPRAALEGAGVAGEVTVIVRSVGERTEAACLALVTDEVGEASVHLVRLAPFAAALRRGFELGIEADRRWTLCLDADVLLRPGAVATLVTAAEAAPETLFEIEGRVADKLLGHARCAGQHLYRTSLLPQAVGLVDSHAGALRPETAVKLDMASAGHGHAEIDAVLGLHDVGQSYVDLFRKALLHGRKHVDDMDYAARYWRRAGAHDADLRVAGWALDTLALFEGDMPVDRRRFPATLETLLTLAGLEEKAPLRAEAFDGAAVEAASRAFAPAHEHLDELRFRELHRRGAVGRARAVLHRYGPLGAPLHVASRVLGGAARRLDAMAAPR